MRRHARGAAPADIAERVVDSSDEGICVHVRGLVALTIIAILLAAATWSLRVLPRASWVPMPPAGRRVVALFLALTLLVAAGWVAFVLPAYWD